MPTVSRSELERADDIIACVGVEKMRKPVTLRAVPKVDSASSCRGKQKHKRNVAVSISKRQGTTHAYRCPHCGYWHIGGIRGSRNG